MKKNIRQVGTVNDKGLLANQIGQFDFAKGLAVLLVVVFHILGLFGWSRNIEEGNILLYILGCTVKIVGVFLIPMFFVISGMGFRSTKNSTCIKKQCRYLLVPYIVTAFITCMFNLVINYACFRYLPGSIAETKKMVYGYLFGNENRDYFLGKSMFRIGPMWFVLTLFFAWILLNMISKLLKDDMSRVRIASCLVLVIGAVLVFFYPQMPFCINQSLIAVFLMNTGYVVKKRKLLFENFKWWEIACSLFAIATTAILGDSDMASNVWKLGIADMLCATIASLFVLKILLRINRIQNIFINIIRWFGKNSLYVVCVHEIETTAIPWYLIVERFSENKVILLVLLIVLRISIVTLGVWCINYIIRKNAKMKKKRVNTTKENVDWKQ